MGLKSIAALAAIGSLFAIGNVHAQSANGWKPTGNVEFVVGAGAGGENDRIARAIQRAFTNAHQVD
jgi:tripartite-type tricarboxylate transporter receptor subunit TctC